MKISRLFWVGFIVFSSILVFYYGIRFLQEESFQSTTFKFSVVFNDLQGLDISDDVKMLGKKIGTITDTKIIDKKVSVELSIDNSFAFKIPVDSKIEVKSEGFLGTKYISIAPGADNNKFIAVGETVYGIGDYDFSEITTEIGPITHDVGVFMNRLNALFRDEERDRIRELIANIESLSNNINEFSDANKDIISSEDKKKIKILIDDLSIASSTLKNKLDKDVSDIIDNMKDLSESTPELKETIENLKNITSSFSKNSQSINTMIANIENKNNTLGRLLHEDSLYININGVALDLRSLIKDVQENPTKYMKAYFQGKK